MILSSPASTVHSNPDLVSSVSDGMPAPAHVFPREPRPSGHGSLTAQAPHPASGMGWPATCSHIVLLESPQPTPSPPKHVTPSAAIATVLEETGGHRPLLRSSPLPEPSQAASPPGLVWRKRSRPGAGQALWPQMPHSSLGSWRAAVGGLPCPGLPPARSSTPHPLQEAVCGAGKRGAEGFSAPASRGPPPGVGSERGRFLPEPPDPWGPHRHRGARFCAHSG